MTTLKEEYENYKKRRKKICQEIIDLEQKSTIQKYKNLIRLNRILKEQEDKVYKAMKYEEYNKCNHVLVYTKEDDKIRDGRVYRYCGCIKCGLDESILKKREAKKTFEEQVQYNYLCTHSKLDGTQTEINCGINLATHIYKNITVDNQDIDDNTLIELFKKEYMDLKEKCNPTETDIHKSKIKKPNE